MPENPAKGVQTDKKRKYVEGISLGMGRMQAAKHAGSLKPHSFVTRMNQDAWVQGQLVEVEKQMREAAGMSREKVMKVVTDAIEIAQIQADPMAMIRGAAELNKMCGYYAPEEKNVNVNANVRRIQTEFEEMDESKLLEAIGEQQSDIEAEFDRLENLSMDEEVEDADFREVTPDA